MLYVKCCSRCFVFLEWQSKSNRLFQKSNLIFFFFFVSNDRLPPNQQNSGIALATGWGKIAGVDLRQRSAKRQSRLQCADGRTCWLSERSSRDRQFKTQHAAALNPLKVRRYATHSRYVHLSECPHLSPALSHTHIQYVLLQVGGISQSQHVC